MNSFIKNKMIKALSFTLALVLTLLSICSCEQNDSPFKISSINDDGTVTVIDADGVSHNYKYEIPKTSEETTEKRDNYLNVKTFGAAGDGTTDDTEAFKQALSALKEGGKLYIPEGTYLIKKNLILRYGNVMIYGDKGRTKLLFEREQTSSDTYENASLLTVTDSAKNVDIRDMTLKYSGSFFEEAGQSYSGMVCGIYVSTGSDIKISGMDISKFNHSGINIAGSSGTYVKRVTIEDCTLHHNRVAGILYGYVDGLSIFSNSMTYNGAESDGGTGYGCAGSSAAHPKNIQVIGNIANYNYRKGIDLHAGERAVIDGNTLKGNRLYGIYAEGVRTSDIIITNNIVSDMSGSTGLESPYATIYGIAFGVYGETNDDYYHNFTVSNNIIRDFDSDTGVSLPFYCYTDFDYGFVKITENTVECKTIDYLISMNRNAAKANYNVSLDFSSNNIYIENLKGIGLILRAKDIQFINNAIHINKYVGGAIVHISGASNSSIIAANNIARVNSYTASGSFIAVTGNKVVRENNIFNGSAD